MAGARKGASTRRYHLTLNETVADRLAAYAAATRRPISTAAALLVTDALTSRRENDAELQAARRQVAELSAHVQALHRQLTEQAGGHQDEQLPPRWEWPIQALFADTEWWDRWLPRLRELLGRRLASLDLQPGRDRRTSPADALVDERGYNDILTFLFPPIATSDGPVTWRSPDYAAAARRDDSTHRQHAAPVRADVWEPVLRHVAEALCALESTGQPGADPYLRLRAEAEITGPWLRALRYLAGEEEPDLPRRRLA